MVQTIKTPDALDCHLINSSIIMKIFLIDFASGSFINEDDDNLNDF